MILRGRERKGERGREREEGRERKGERGREREEGDRDKEGKKCLLK